MGIRGSCCCGGIAFVLSEPPQLMGTCHCSRCRKLGEPTFVLVRRDTFTLIRGADAIETYVAKAPLNERNFCRHCGTGLGEWMRATEMFPLNAQLFDDDPGLDVSFHEYVADKPRWSAIGDDAPRFPGEPPRPR